MKWWNRFKILVKADAHAVLEQIEDHSLLVKQHFREAEIELDRKRARCEALADESRALSDDVERLREEIEALDEDVELALSGENVDLARFAVRRLLPKRRALEDSQRRRSDVDSEIERLQAVLCDQEVQFEELKRMARAKHAARESSDHAMTFEVATADEDVELELLRRRTARAVEAS